MVTETLARPARWAPAVRVAAPAVGLYLALRALSMTVLYLLARGHSVVLWDGTLRGRHRVTSSFTDLLLSWDGRWYTLIAAHGYGTPGRLDANGIGTNVRLAFFPLYPLLIRIVDGVPGLGIDGAALLTSVLSSVAAAWGIFAIGDHLRGRDFGVVLAALWGVAPACFVQDAAFTESLFTALCAWALYAVLTRRWLLAGSLTLLCGLTRPTAIALIGAVGLAAVVSLVRREDGWRPVVCLLLAPIGYAGYLAYAASRLGGLGGYFRLQREHFGTRFDFGAHTLHVLDSGLTGTALVVIGTVLLLVVLAVPRVPLAVFAFALLIVAEALGSATDFSSMPRHLMPAFPLLIPLASLVTSRARPLVGATLVTLALLSGWYGGWLPLHAAAVI